MGRFFYFKGLICEKTKDCSLSGYFSNPKTHDLVLKLKDSLNKEKRDLIYTVVKKGNELSLCNMGKSSSPLIEENYLPNVIRDFNYVIKSFSKDPPNGRIAILNGEPGTGKSFLIKSFVSKLEMQFIILPPNLIDAVDKPEFLPLLIETKKQYEKPICLIIEDGDICLVPRKNDNISIISALLNMSDGILGSLLDIKMIVTTNAQIKDMDGAILRPGRLCKNINVGPLPYEQANKIYQRLKNESLEYRKYYTLAEIYELANSIEGNLSQLEPRKSIGFTSEPLNSNKDSGKIFNKRIGF